MSVELEESRQLMNAAVSREPEAGLTVVVALRQLVEVLEELQVSHARSTATRWSNEQLLSTCCSATSSSEPSACWCGHSAGYPMA
jgi:hypothetical protein